MEYNKIVAVTGLGGLFELVSSKADGGIVRSLEDGSSKFVSNRIHNFSHLESIEIYTTTDNVNLAEVFMAMQNSKEKAPDAKADNNALKAYFAKVYPAMDFERVYSSDMKKMVKWLDILTRAGIQIKQAAESEAEDAPEEKAVVAEKKAPKAAAAKNTAAPKSNAPAKKINAPRKMA